MILAINVTFVNVALGVLIVGLAVLIFVIAYRKLLAYMGKGVPPKEDYCVLYEIEDNPAKGEIVIYFTSKEKKQFKMELLNNAFETVQELANKECQTDGNMVRFDTTTIANGTYYYQLVTDNQKIFKKMLVKN